MRGHVPSPPPHHASHAPRHGAQHTAWQGAGVRLVFIRNELMKQRSRACPWTTRERKLWSLWQPERAAPTAGISLCDVTFRVCPFWWAPQGKGTAPTPGPAARCPAQGRVLGPQPQSIKQARTQQVRKDKYGYFHRPGFSLGSSALAATRLRASGQGWPLRVARAARLPWASGSGRTCPARTDSRQPDPRLDDCRSVRRGI